jgi:NAD(P)H-dependent flavin oxidoreductase YrpB (nitropropane dioxygenase family)
MLDTAFTRLVGCSVPIQQAGMGGIADAPLARAVSDAGALGMVNMVMVPATEVAAGLEVMAQQTDGVFGINFLMPFLDVAAVEASARVCRVVEFFYGEPDASLVARVHRGGALAVWQVGTAEEARQAEGAGCDFLVAQGVEAGGHVRGRLGVLTLLAQVLDSVAVPVLAAGGIGTGRAMAGALAAGAAGVRVGTRFVAAAESPAHPAYVDALLGAGSGDTMVTTAFSVMWPDAPHRVLASCVEAMKVLEGDVVGEMRMGDMSVPIPKGAVPCPRKDTTGAIEAMPLYAGESVDAVTRRQPAREIVEELAREAERLLRAWD